MLDATYGVILIVCLYACQVNATNFLNKNNLSFVLSTTSLIVFLLSLFLIFQSLNFSINYMPTQYSSSLKAVIFNQTTTLTVLQQALFASGILTSVIFVSIIVTKPSTIIFNAMISLFILAGIAFVFSTTESLILFLVAFELLLLTSLYLLRLTSKSERVIEASVEMFFWTLIGSLALLTAFTWLFTSGVYTFDSLASNTISTDFFAVLLLIGFGVKIPIWPFFSWLLKAHVEASVEFSILLSGFIVKLGVFGLAKLYFLTVNIWAALFLFAFSLLGLTTAVCRLFAQRDLKRIVALTTVIEMNWLGLCLALGGANFDNLVAYLIVAHSITTALEFFLVEIITKRFGVRDSVLVSGLFHQLPLLAVVSFFVILLTIGFPGTPLFLAKFLFLVELTSVSWFLSFFVAFMLLLVLPLFFIKLWAPIWFGLNKKSSIMQYDLTSTELLIFGILFLFALVITFWPALILTF